MHFISLKITYVVLGACKGKPDVNLHCAECRSRQGRSVGFRHFGTRAAARGEDVENVDCLLLHTKIIYNIEEDQKGYPQKGYP